jgi:hypothetical protein
MSDKKAKSEALKRMLRQSMTHPKKEEGEGKVEREDEEKQNAGREITITVKG